MDPEDKSKDKFHSPEEIRDYVVRNYPELANGKGMSIGVLGGFYRLAITDSQDILLTLHVDPKDIDADRKKNLSDKSHAGAPKTRDDDRLERARKTAAAVKAKSGRGNGHDHDRER